MSKPRTNDDIGDKELREFLSRPFAIDCLYPVFGQLSVDTIFEGWRGEEINGWYRFQNSNSDVLEFFPEGTYVIKKNSPKKEIFQYRIPKTIFQFITDLEKHGIPIALKT